MPTTVNPPNLKSLNPKSLNPKSLGTSLPGSAKRPASEVAEEDRRRSDNRYRDTSNNLQ